MFNRIEFHLVLAVVVILAVFGVGMFVATPEAECAYCYQGDCYGNAICGQGCQCMRKNTWSPGTCVTFQNKE